MAASGRRAVVRLVVPWQLDWTGEPEEKDEEGKQAQSKLVVKEESESDIVGVSCVGVVEAYGAAPV